MYRDQQNFEQTYYPTGTHLQNQDERFFFFPFLLGAAAFGAFRPWGWWGPWGYPYYRPWGYWGRPWGRPRWGYWGRPW